MSFVKRSNAAPVCHSKPLDSVKNWNDHFFWVDSTAFPPSVSLKSKILSKDPPPQLSRYDTEACDFLRTHTAPFQKFPEPFLCWVGISRYYTLDENCYPTYWDGEEEMDLFAFIRHSDPTKVRIGERDLAEREGNDVGQEHSVERNDDILEETIAKDASKVVAEKTKKKRKRRSLPPNTGRKSLAALRGMIPEGSGIPSGATEPLIATSMAPMPDVGHVDSISELNLSLIVDALVVTVVVTTIVDADVAAVPGSKARDTSKDFENIGDSASAGGQMQPAFQS
ncbi:hypothetical protein Tco_0598883 [Tanacetum coccineum]